MPMLSKTHSFLFLSLLFLFLCFPCISHWKPNTSKASSNKDIIVIDVGHGGYDPGKVSINGTREKDVNLQIAKLLQTALQSKGYTTFLSRNKDISLCDPNSAHPKQSDLRNRVLFIEKKQATLAISIHQNSFPDSSVHGAQVFYSESNPRNKELATQIEQSLYQMNPASKRPSKPTNAYYILKHSPCSTVLLECGFLSNPSEELLLTNSEYQKKFANAIAMGICKFLK